MRTPVGPGECVPWTVASRGSTPRQGRKGALMTQLAPNKPGKRRDYLHSYVERDGCWIYTGSINNRGYGTILGRAAHRYFYEHLVGPIPDGLTIDHLCRTKACVNPAHLEPVSMRRNAQRRPDVNKTHCVNGHAMTEDNTVIKLNRGRWEIRNCRICKADSQRRVRERKKAA